MEFVLVPFGEFRMGSEKTEEGRSAVERPKHVVRIPAPFYLGKYEVTQAQWKAILGSNPSRFRGDDRPVDSVSWADSRKFLETLNQRLAESGRGAGTELRMPSESEWEAACRAGSQTRFSGGDGLDALERAGWFSGNAGGGTHPVGRKAPNAWGFHDMHGNVREPCLDFWHGTYRNAPADGSPWLRRSGSSKRVFRGGSFRDDADACRAASRFPAGPMQSDPRQGLRVCFGPRRTGPG
jgi:formylglycine-generating enzyme required for sulfatase activity